MNNFKYFSDLKTEIADIPSDGIISQMILKEGKSKAILFGFAPGQELSEHTVAQPATLHFMEGEADVALGDDSLQVQAGAWVYLPANMPHSILAKTRVVMLLMMV